MTDIDDESARETIYWLKQGMADMSREAAALRTRAEKAEATLLNRAGLAEQHALLANEARDERDLAERMLVAANETIAAVRGRAEKAESERDEAIDCGQDGVCRVAPGCQRHWAERNRELARERDVFSSDALTKRMLEMQAAMQRFEQSESAALARVRELEEAGRDIVHSCEMGNTPRLEMQISHLRAALERGT